MRYFRVTCNPLSPEVLAGPGGNSVSVRLHYALTAQMIYAVFVDGGYVAVPDEDMGQWGGPTDFLRLDSLGENYLLFQESVPIVPLELIPLWSSQLVPYDTAPEVLPTAWPAVVVVPG